MFSTPIIKLGLLKFSYAYSKLFHDYLKNMTNF